MQAKEWYEKQGAVDKAMENGIIPPYFWGYTLFLLHASIPFVALILDLVFMIFHPLLNYFYSCIIKSNSLTHYVLHRNGIS